MTCTASPFAALLFAGSLAGCAAPPQVAAADEPTRYACDDGTFLSVDFTSSRAAVTGLDGTTVALARRSAAAGFRYEADGYALGGTGDKAVWEERGSPPTACLAT